jgi:hypothetical protein
MSNAMSEQCDCAGGGCYVYTVGMQMRWRYDWRRITLESVQTEAALVARRQQDQDEGQATL